MERAIFRSALQKADIMIINGAKIGEYWIKKIKLTCS